MARKPNVKGTSTAISVQVRGVPALHRALAKLLEPELTQAMDKANKQGANVYAKALRPAVGARSSRMRKAVRVKRAKTGKPGWVIGSKRKIAFFWPFVIGGTRAHGPRKARALAFQVGGNWVRASRVSGVPADPIVERVGRGSEREVARIIEDTFAKETGL
jgi:hypothetical protein